MPSDRLTETLAPAGPGRPAVCDRRRRSGAGRGPEGRRERRPLATRRRRAGGPLADRRRAPPGRPCCRPGSRRNVVARLKVLAELLTYRTDVPQEGRIRGTPGEIEMRLSTFPTLYGEKAVVRLFAAPGRFLRLDDLGLPDEIRDGLSRGARRDLGRDRLQRAGGQRQDDHALRLPPRAGGTPAAASAAWRRSRTRSRWPSPGVVAIAGQPGRRVHPGARPAVAAPPGPRGHRRRRDPRPDHRRDRLPGLAHRPPRPDHLPRRQRRGVIGRLPDMGIEPYLSGAACWPSSPSAWSAGSAMPAPSPRIVPRTASACRSTAPGFPAAATPAAAPATSAALSWPRCSCPTPTSSAAPSSPRRRPPARADRRRGRHGPPLGTCLPRRRSGRTSPAEIRRVLGVATPPGRVGARGQGLGARKRRESSGGKPGLAHRPSTFPANPWPLARSPLPLAPRAGRIPLDSLGHL